MVPGDLHPTFTEMEAARQVLTDAEDELRGYELHIEPIHSSANKLGIGAMPDSVTTTSAAPEAVMTTVGHEGTVQSDNLATERQYDAGVSAAPPVEESRVAEPNARQEVTNVA